MRLKRISFEGVPHIKTIALLLLLTISAAIHPRIASAQVPILDQAFMGWDGDRNAVKAHLDGSYHIRLYAMRYDGMPTPTPAPSPATIDVSFGIYSSPTPAPSPGSVRWYNKEGYLPCLVSKFTQDHCTVTIENFGDNVQLTPGPGLQSHPYVLIYSRVTITNNDLVQRTLCPAPSVSPTGPNAGLVSLTPNLPACSTLGPGQTVKYDYVIAADRYGHNEYPWPTKNNLATANGGSWDTAYAHMKNYWQGKLSHVTNIAQLPDLVTLQDGTIDSRLKNAYKAGYIYTHIVKDGNELMVGEERYDDGDPGTDPGGYNPYYTDKLGILATLLTIGDPDALTYLNAFPTDPLGLSIDQYAVARWQYPWLWAIYLEKTNDTASVRAAFAAIQAFAHNIHADRCLTENPNHWDCSQPYNRLMRKTLRELGTRDYWSIDDWSGLMGLASYKYICDTLGCDACSAEASWASAEYNDLLSVVNNIHQQTINSYTPPLNYLPISMVLSNCETLPHNFWDGNWAVVLSFGRWAWDASLLGAYQNPDDVEIRMLDTTYAFGLQGAEAHGLGSHNFGSYAAPLYSSAYNAGYGSAGLRGEIYRSEGIRAYQFILDNGQKGPYSWLESFTFPENGPWEGVHPEGIYYIVSCPHTFGQSTATKVLVDSLIALKFEGTNGLIVGRYGVVIGRGVPNEWISGGKVIEVSNFPIENQKRMGFNLTSLNSQKLTLDLTGDAPGDLGALLDLQALKKNIKSVSPDSIQWDYEKGTVTIPPSVRHVEVNLQRPNPTPVPTPTPAPTPPCP